MRESDFAPFAQLLDEVWQLKGQNLQTGAKALWFRALSAYALEAVRAALGAHLADPDRGRFLPMPADILGQLASFDGRPGAEEAWSIAIRGQDEADTIVWTDEAREAFGICLPVLQAGDEVGARMAFREAYGRLVEEARRARRPANWSPSFGHDPQRRDRALADAAARGLIDASRFPSLPAPREAVALLSGPEPAQGIPDEARAALLALRNWLTTPAEDDGSEDARAKAETQRRAKEAQRLVAERVGGETLQ